LFNAFHSSDHRFLSLPTASYHSPLVLSFSTAPCHCPPLPISPPLPITLHCVLLLSTASYYSPPLPITPHRVLLFPTVSYHSSLVLSFSTASYHSPPRPIIPHRLLSLCTASYHTPLCPIIPHHSLSLHTFSNPIALYRCLPLAITPHLSIIPHRILAVPAGNYLSTSLPCAS